MSWSYREFSSKRASWQKHTKGWESHTVPPIKAKLLVNGYIKLLKKLKCFDGYPNREDIKVLDIGAGAGYIGQAFFENGFSVLCTEHTKEGVSLINRHNPKINTSLLEISDVKNCIDSTYDLILCRELYPFTRVNCFEEQKQVVENIMSLLKKGGTLLLIGSTISYPHCADYRLILLTLNKKNEYKYLYSYSEPFISRRYLMFFGLSFIRFLSYWVMPILKFMLGYANIKIYVLHKNKT